MASAAPATARWLHTNAHNIYRSPARVIADIQPLLDAAPSLRPKTDIYTYDDGRTQLLLCIHGTIPIAYRAASYNIPVAIWLPVPYPAEPPTVYVVPTQDMLVRKSQSVDVSGRTDIQYLRDWKLKPESCSLSKLVEAMTLHFSANPPLYAKPRQQEQSRPPPLPHKPFAGAPDHSPSTNPSSPSPQHTSSSSTSASPSAPSTTASSVYPYHHPQTQHRHAPSPLQAQSSSSPLQAPANHLFTTQTPPAAAPHPQGLVAPYTTTTPSHARTQTPLTPVPTQGPSTPAPASSERPPPVPPHPPSIGGGGPGVALGASSYGPSPSISASVSPPPYYQPGRGVAVQYGVQQQQQQQHYQQQYQGQEGQVASPRPMSSPASPPLPPRPPVPPSPFQHHVTTPPAQGQQQQLQYVQQNGGAQVAQYDIQAQRVASVPTNAFSPPPPQVQPQLTYGASPYPQQTQVQPQPRVPPPDLLSSDDTEPAEIASQSYSSPSVSSTITGGFGPGGPAPPRPPNPELLRLHAALHTPLHTALAQLASAQAASAAKQQELQRALLAGAPAVRDEGARLVAVRDVCRGVAARLRGVVRDAEGAVGEVRRRGEVEVDEMVCASSIVGNQLINLVAEDNAIEDTMYHLHRALNTGRIDLERFLRTTRVLAEEQFMKRALVEKIQRGLPMGMLRHA